MASFHSTTATVSGSANIARTRAAGSTQSAISGHPMQALNGPARIRSRLRCDRPARVLLFQHHRVVVVHASHDAVGDQDRQQAQMSFRVGMLLRNGGPNVKREPEGLMSSGGTDSVLTCALSCSLIHCGFPGQTRLDPRGFVAMASHPDGVAAQRLAEPAPDAAADVVADFPARRSARNTRSATAGCSPRPAAAHEREGPSVFSRSVKTQRRCRTSLPAACRGQPNG